MKALYLFVVVLATTLTTQSQSVYNWQDTGLHTTAFDYMPPYPEFITMMTIDDTTTWKSFFPEVYYKCLADSNAVEYSPLYILTADEDGKIMKVHKDSLHFQPQSEGMQMMSMEPLTTQQAADYVIDKVEYFDLNGNKITPAKSKDYVVVITFLNGQTVTQHYIEQK